MSLVEQASKRLEDLRRAGSEVAGELAYPPGRDSEEQAPPTSSTIERAVKQLEARRAQHAQQERQDNGPARASSSLGAIDAHVLDRREPKLDLSASATAHAGSAAQSLQRLELDFRMLTARGYLNPDDSESALANQFRKVKWPLIQACQGKANPRVEKANRIMVTSSVPGEGKSFVSLNLALSIAAERDYTVVLIDADTTRPSLSQLLGAASSYGLLDLLESTHSHAANALLSTNVEKLYVLPAGKRRRHATELLASEVMEQLVQRLATECADRILIFDTPPLLAAPEPAVLASYMGQILVVAEADKTTQGTLKSALATIETCPVVRMLLNKAPSANERYSYAG
jgi:exopolysaccharide/PEP-CTERM locus tyrosine autokinase